jgi:hypothetical protein
MLLVYTLIDSYHKLICIFELLLTFKYIDWLTNILCRYAAKYLLKTPKNSNPMTPNDPNEARRKFARQTGQKGVQAKLPDHCTAHQAVRESASRLLSSG